MVTDSALNVNDDDNSLSFDSIKAHPDKFVHVIVTHLNPTTAVKRFGMNMVIASVAVQ